MFARRLLLLAFAWVVLLVPGRSFAQIAKVGDLEQQVLKAHEDLKKAQVNVDLAAMDRLWADGHTHTHTNGLVEAKSGFIEGFKAGTRRYEAIDTSDVKVRFYGPTTAIITGAVCCVCSDSPPAKQ